MESGNPMKPHKLSDAEERELREKIELRRSLSDKRLCQHYGIGRRTLWDIISRQQNDPRETAHLVRILTE